MIKNDNTRRIENVISAVFILAVMVRHALNTCSFYGLATFLRLFATF